MASQQGFPITYGYSYMQEPIDLRTISSIRPQEADPSTLIGMLASSPQYGLFTNLLRKSGLDAVLRNEKNLTVFVVPDRYIKTNFLENVYDIDPARAFEIISFHILPYRMTVADLQTDLMYLVTMNPHYKLRVDGRGTSPQLGTRKMMTSTTPSMNFTPEILKGDVVGSNGIMHVINALLLPPPLAGSTFSVYD